MTNSPTSTEQVIERLARAIHDKQCELCDPPYYSEELARAAIEALPPKPVDGEVAEPLICAKCKRDTHALWADDLCAECSRGVNMSALSRNTELMVTDAMIEAGKAAFEKHTDLLLTNGDYRTIYLAMLSAGKKGTDDDE